MKKHDIEAIHLLFTSIKFPRMQLTNLIFSSSATTQLMLRQKQPGYIDGVRSRHPYSSVMAPACFSQILLWPDICFIGFMDSSTGTTTKSTASFHAFNYLMLAFLKVNTASPKLAWKCQTDTFDRFVVQIQYLPSYSPTICTPVSAAVI